MMNKNETPDYQNKFEECTNRFDSVFKLTSVATKIIDSELTILKVNKAMADLLGYTAEEIIGTEIMDYACEEYKEHWSHLQEELWRKKSPFFKLTACLLKKDRSVVWVNVTTILYNENGVTFGYSILDDITGRKRFEESEKRLNLAMHYSKMAVWEMDLKDFSVIRSETHDQIFGYRTPLTVWNKDTYLRHFLPEDARLFEKAFNGNNHQLFDFKGRIQTDDMAFKWLHMQGEAELDARGRKSKIIGTIKDITKDKLLERQKDDFISIASHELKTPVTTLKLSLQLLNKLIENPVAKLKDLITQTNRSMSKVSALIDDLLSATSISEGQLQLCKSTFVIAHIIDGCCEFVRSSGNYTIKTEGDTSLVVTADAERVEQVISNLINNAIKYAPDSKEIVITLERFPQTAKISISDRGPGIPAEKLPHLFDRFYRAESSGSQYSGLGLGLYICAEIIKKHGGEIGADSEMGKGSTFWFTLPLSS